MQPTHGAPVSRMPGQPSFALFGSEGFLFLGGQARTPITQASVVLPSNEVDYVTTEHQSNVHVELACVSQASQLVNIVNSAQTEQRLSGRQVACQAFKRHSLRFCS